MSIIDTVEQFPPFLRYLTYATAAAILGFFIHAMMPKKQSRALEPSIFVRYLAMGFIFAGLIYLIFNHREILHV